MRARLQIPDLDTRGARLCAGRGRRKQERQAGHSAKRHGTKPAGPGKFMHVPIIL